MTTSSAQGLQPREVKIRVHDRVEIAVALYMPAGDGPCQWCHPLQRCFQ